MFEARELSPVVTAVRDEHAPDAGVYDCRVDFETLDPAQAEDLGLLVDRLDPQSYPAEWLPADAPELLQRYAGGEFTIGLPGDGSVVWTRQTAPPTVLVKPRVAGSPESFVDFLVAEALVEAGLGVPEQFLGFFEDDYRALADATPLDGNDTYQLAVALYDAWVGLQTRETFREWPDAHPGLGAAWRDAGERLVDRVDGLAAEVARGETSFPAAAELACSGVKHDLDLPAPFDALDTAAYRDRGAPYAVAWAEKTFASLRE
jgi:hypothetical protein